MQEDTLDDGIREIIIYLRSHEINTFSSCQGGEGHAFLFPTVHFHGDDSAGLWAVWLLESEGYKVSWLSRTWDLNHGCPRQPFWEIVLKGI